MSEDHCGSVIDDLRQLCDQADRLVAMGRDRFEADEWLQLASEALVLRLSEAASRLPHEFRAAHPEVPWRAIAATRILVAHQYHLVDHGILWQGLAHGLDELRAAVAG